jgi:hypothetical protein
MLPQSAEALDDLDATPEQRRLYKQAKWEEGSSQHEFFEDYANDLYLPMPRR